MNRKEEVAVARDYKVIKANAIIQRARYDLSLQELKIMSYCFSMIKPNDIPGQEYIFSISDYCRICGINDKSGWNYKEFKALLKGLRDKSFWITNDDGSESTVGWLGKVNINRGSGKVKIKFDEDMQHYILGLFENFTQYELLSTLPMRSQYSFRIYEILKSYAWTKKHTFDLPELKKQLAAEHYVNFKDFRKKVIEKAVAEINEFTDLSVNYETVKSGAKVVKITFFIKQKDVWGRYEASTKAIKQLDGQMTIGDFINE